MTRHHRHCPARWAVAHERANALHDLGDRQQTLHARKVDSAVIDEVFDEFQPLQLVAGVEAHASDRAGWPHQTEPLVFSKRLGMHAEHPRRDADEVQVVVGPHVSC